MKKPKSTLDMFLPTPRWAGSSILRGFKWHKTRTLQSVAIKKKELK